MSTETVKKKKKKKITYFTFVTHNNVQKTFLLLII